MARQKIFSSSSRHNFYNIHKERGLGFFYSFVGGIRKNLTNKILLMRGLEKSGGSLSLLDS